MSKQPLITAINTFVDHYCKSFTVLTREFDPEWPSPCEVGNAFDSNDGDSTQSICWRPVQREPSTADFSGLENALGYEVHADVKTHYGQFWSGNLEAQAPDGHVSLLYLWSPADVDRLIENLIGHVVACRNNKTPFAVFFACTDPQSDYYLTINNDTGEVQLEQPGSKPLRTVCPSLTEFYAQLVPSTQS